MKINIVGQGVELTESLKEYAVKKLNKIEHFFSNIQQVDFELVFNNTKEEAGRQIARATVFLSGSTWFSPDILSIRQAPHS